MYDILFSSEILFVILMGYEFLIVKGFIMSVERVCNYFRQFGLDDKVMEFDVSSATVDLAAEAVGVEGARICKTISFKRSEIITAAPVFKINLIIERINVFLNAVQK